jgi:hypothetical protein
MVLGLLLLLCVLLLQGQVAESAVFTVGGSGGWTFNSNTWTNGRRFKAGDVLGHPLLIIHSLELVLLYIQLVI